MNATRILLLFLYLLSGAVVPVVAQSTLHGRVRLPDSSMATMAVVKVLAADSPTLARYTRTSQLGDWSIDKVAPGQYVLQVSYLGLETWAEHIAIAEPDTLFFDITLQEHPLTLRMVEISAKRIGIVERGDTLQYDLSYYLDSTEYNLKDILNRLPDMSVGDDGSIRYKGKRVHLALVEGRDVFGNMHKVMTEGVAAENVKGVQVIRNYTTGAEQEAKAISDKVAINVQLTDEARQKLNGELGINTDAHKFAEGAVTLYQTRPKWGYSLIARGNNTGQMTIFPADLFALLDFEALQPKKGTESMEPSVSPLLVPQPDAQRNVDMLGAMSIDASLTARWNSKLDVRFIKADRRMENVLFRLYIQDNTDFTGIRSRQNDANMWQANLKNDYRGKNTWVKQRLLVASTLAPGQTRLNGALAGTSIESQFFQQADQLDIKAALEGGMGVDSQSMLIGRVQYQYSGRHDRARLQSPDALFGTPDSLLEQRNDAREAVLSGEASLRHPIGAQQLTTSMGYSHTSYMLEANTLLEQPAAGWDMEAKMSDASIFGGIALRRPGKFRYTASTKATLLQRTFPTWPSRRYRSLLSDIQAGIHRDFALLHSLYINAGYTTSPTPFVHLWRYNRLRDENSLFAERVDSFFVQRETFVNLLYMRTGMDNGYRLFLTHTASIKKNEVLYQTIPNGNYLLYQSLLAPHITQLSTEGRVAYRLKPARTDLGASVRHEFKSGFAALSEQLLSVNNHRLNIDFSLTFDGWKRLKVGANHVHIRSSQRYGGQDALTFYNNRTMATASYQHGKWRANISAAYNHQRVSLTPNQYWILGFDVERRFSKPSIRVRLTGRNVLNLKGNAMLMPDFGANYVGFSAFQTIGGQIMAGVAYVF